MPDERIIELDWGEQADVGELRLICTAARHFSGRGLARNNDLVGLLGHRGPDQRVFFGGDTGYTAGFAGIG